MQIADQLDTHAWTNAGRVRPACRITQATDEGQFDLSIDKVTKRRSRRTCKSQQQRRSSKQQGCPCGPNKQQQKATCGPNKKLIKHANDTTPKNLNQINVDISTCANLTFWIRQIGGSRAARAAAMPSR